MFWLWAALADEGTLAEPTDQTLVYYNARMALREGQPGEAAKLWLVRNALESRTKRVSAQDDDFKSVTLAAMGELGVCQDGMTRDNGGAGLWPVAIHNWTVRNMRRRGVSGRSNPFNAFKVERQQRFISMADVLSQDELRTVSFYRGRCIRARWRILEDGRSPLDKISKRENASMLLRALLIKSRKTLTEDVRGKAVIEARIFDIDLQLTELAARLARQKARRKARTGREGGLSRAASEDLRDSPEVVLSPTSRAVLEASVHWPISEWMSLSDERRKFVFHHAKEHGGGGEVFQLLALNILDELAKQQNGHEVRDWISYIEEPERVWGGDRGERLLNIEEDFDERAVLALHRGVDQLEEGDMPRSLRSLAFALQHANESTRSDEMQGLCRRWLSYVASQFELTDDLVAMLQRVVPRLDYSVIIEDMLWTATFHVDETSFNRALNAQLGRGALKRRARLLEPLATGELDTFERAIRDGIESSPSETLRFLTQLVERLETENLDVRTAHLATLQRVSRWVTPYAGQKGRRGRNADELLARFQAIREGIEKLDPTANSREKAISLSPTGEVFAGAVRVAPSDPLPWPFPVGVVPAPSVYTPVYIRPLEWREDGDLVFGWAIHE